MFMKILNMDKQKDYLNILMINRAVAVILYNSVRVFEFEYNIQLKYVMRMTHQVLNKSNKRSVFTMKVMLAAAKRSSRLFSCRPK